MAEKRKKTCDIVCEANEAAHVRARHGRRPLRDVSDLAGVDRDAEVGNDVAEEADGGVAKSALGGLSIQLVVQQRLEHHTHVHQVLTTRLEMRKSSRYTCTNRPVGAPEPVGPADPARPVE